jgi:hypothetical protein
MQKSVRESGLTGIDPIGRLTVFVKKAQSVMGHRITEPRPTLMAVWLVFLYVGIPLLVITGLLDLAMQIVFGVCTGLWCLA